MFEVLVAEDEVWIRDAVSEMVEKLAPDFQVAGEAGNGEEAWNFIQEHCPSILITDIMMPVKNGLWLCETIHTLNLPIAAVIISGYDNFQYAKKAMRFGVDEYLLKPLDEEELHGALLRTVKRLEGMAESHQGVLRIQRFVEQIPGLDRKELVHEMNELLSYILRLNVHVPGSKKILLAILTMKLNAILPKPNMKPLTDESEPEIRRRFTAWIDEWLVSFSPHTGDHVHAAIKKICTLLDSRYYDNFTLAGLADMAHMSVSHFSMLFKKTTGQTFVNYLNQVRMAKAKELLQEPDLKVYEVADMVGYSSLPYFNRTFKQIVSITPAEYRKRIGL